MLSKGRFALDSGSEHLFSKRRLGYGCALRKQIEARGTVETVPRLLKGAMCGRP